MKTSAENPPFDSCFRFERKTGHSSHRESVARDRQDYSLRPLQGLGIMLRPVCGQVFPFTDARLGTTWTLQKQDYFRLGGHSTGTHFDE
jgi:hypothetical protein